VAEFGSVRAIVTQVWEAVGAGPKVEDDFAIEPEFRQAVADATAYFERLAEIPSTRADERCPAAFWGIVGPFLVVDGCRFVSSAYGPLFRTALPVVEVWWDQTMAGLEQLAELCDKEASRADAAAAAGAVLPLTRTLVDITADWYAIGVTGIQVRAEMAQLRNEVESAAATLGSFEVTQ
jgi:hypothetical protein